jgi:hypothetical protein
MAVLTAEAVSGLALELLGRRLVLPNTFARIPAPDYTGTGGTVTVRVRQPRSANTQDTPGAGPITFTPLDEVPVEVELVHHYDATKLTDEALTLELVDFGRQVLEPMTSAVAAAAESTGADALNDLNVGAEVIDLDEDGSDIEVAILEARKRLGRDEVPMGNRWLAVSPEVASLVLAVDKVSRVDSSGSSSALRDAVIGKLFGFAVVESAALDEGTAYAYHSSGVAFANVAPARPRGAASSAVSSADGISLRTVFDFDPSTLSDVAAISTFAGASPVHEDGDDATELKRIVKLAISES